MMGNFLCRDKAEFNVRCQDLALFAAGHENHRQIILGADGRPVGTATKSCWLTRIVRWIQRLFTCAEHPAQRVADQVLKFFEDNRSYIDPEHVVAISGILGIKKTTDLAGIVRRTHALLAIAKDSQRYIERARKEQENEIQTQKEGTEKQCERLRQETAALMDQEGAVRRQTQQELDRVNNEAARVLSEARSVAVEIRRDGDKHFAEIGAFARSNADIAKAKALAQMQLAIAQASIRGAAAAQAEQRKADTIIATAKRDCDLKAGEAETKRAAMMELIEQDLLHRRQQEETKNREELEKCEQQIKDLELRLQTAEKELQDLPEKLRQLEQEGQQLKAQQEEAGRKLGQGTVDKANADAAQRREDAQKEAEGLQIKHQKKIEAEKKQVEEDQKRYQQNIERLKRDIKQLQLAKADICSKIHAVKEPPVTFICSDGEVPNVRYELLKDIKFLAEKIKNRPKAADAEVKQVKAEGLAERDGKALVAAKGATDEDIARKLSDPKRVYIDMRPFSSATVKEYFDLLMSKRRIPAERVDLFALLLFMQITSVDQVKESLKSQDLRKCLLLLTKYEKDMTVRPYWDCLFEHIGNHFAAWVQMPELKELSSDLLIKILKNPKLGPLAYFPIIKNWFEGKGKQIESLLIPNATGETVLSVALQVTQYRDQEKLLMALLPEAVPASPVKVEQLKKENGNEQPALGVVKYEQHIPSQIQHPSSSWNWTIPNMKSVLERLKKENDFTRYSPEFTWKGHKFKFGLQQNGEKTIMKIKCTSSAKLSYTTSVRSSQYFYSFDEGKRQKWITVLPNNDIDIALHKQDLDENMVGDSWMIGVDINVAEADAKLEQDKKANEEVLPGKIISALKPRGLFHFWTIARMDQLLERLKSNPKLIIYCETFEHKGAKFRFGWQASPEQGKVNVLVECISDKIIKFEPSFTSDSGRQVWGYQNALGSWLTRTDRLVVAKFNLKEDVTDRMLGGKSYEIGVTLDLRS